MSFGEKRLRFRKNKSRISHFKGSYGLVGVAADPSAFRLLDA